MPWLLNHGRGSHFTSLSIQRAARFAIGITELNTGSSDEGIVGSLGIRIPYRITQEEDSKATSVKVTVFNDNRPGTLKADSCAFHTDLNGTSDQVIAVPFRLDFYNPTAYHPNKFALLVVMKPQWRLGPRILLGMWYLMLTGTGASLGWIWSLI